MNCQECKDRMYPLDPSKPVYKGGGKYFPAICNTCPNKEPDNEIHPPVKREPAYIPVSKPVYQPNKRYEDYINA